MVVQHISFTKKYNNVAYYKDNRIKVLQVYEVMMSLFWSACINSFILTIFFLVLTVCFVYKACQKAIKNLKNKYKK